MNAVTRKTASSSADAPSHSPARWLAAALSVLGAGGGLALGLHHPIAPTLACAAFVLVAAMVFGWPRSWLVMLPACLPVVGFAPWTGWITFEELDLLVLACATGAYARMAWAPPPRGHRRTRHRGTQALAWIAIALFGLSVLVAMLRGIADAGGWSFGWFQGYREPMNSVRLAKSFFMALLLMPVWRVLQRQDADRAQALLGTGLALGLGTAALTTVWERAAFTGLLNFSSDYRTTGMFWEMHVGGAALDGFLVLTVPFAVRELMAARSALRWSLAAVVAALGAYASLTTFSRGVYLALVVACPILLVAWQRQQRANSAPLAEQAPSWQPAIGLLVAFGLAGSWMFQTSGYRGMAALWGTMALMLPAAHALRILKASQWAVAAVLAAATIALAALCSWLVPKGAYVAWAFAFLGTAAVLLRMQMAARPAWVHAAWALAGLMGTAVATVLIAHHWGEAPGLQHAWPVVVALSLVMGAVQMRAQVPWPSGWRWQAASAASMALVGGVIAVFGGGAYMGERFSTGSQDFGGRLVHWKIAQGLLDTPADWWLGKGLGRFPASFAVVDQAGERPGDYRVQRDGDNYYLTLASGLGLNGWGEVFRVTQRIGVPAQGLVVTLRTRAAKNVTLHAEVCEKHLLYADTCAIGVAGVQASPGAWQAVRMELKGSTVGRGPWYAPRLVAFSIAVESRDGLADVDDVTLTDAQGQQWLVNGDFTADMNRWFFSSDRVHMPWHAKSMLVNTLFDQGVVGAVLLCVLTAAALWRTLWGSARNHALAPALAASLAGFAVVGLFDSLLDVPRVAWLFYLMVLISLTLNARAPAEGRPVSRA